MSQKLFIKTIYFSCVVILFLPLLITPFTMYPMHYGRTMIFEIIIEILFLFSVFGFLFFGLKFPRLNLLDKSILIFLAVQFIAAIFGVDFQMSFFGNMGRVQGVLTWWHFGVWYFLLRFLFTRSYTNEDTDKHSELLRRVGGYGADRFLKVAGVASLLVTLSALLAPLIPYLRMQVGGWGRISGTIGNPIFFASYLILPIFLNLYLTLQACLKGHPESEGRRISQKEQRDKPRLASLPQNDILKLERDSSPAVGGVRITKKSIFWLFVVLLEIFALIQSGTRGAIIGFAVSILFLLSFGFIASFKVAEMKKWRRIFVVCLVIIFLISGVLSYLGFSGKHTGIATVDRLTTLVSFKGTGATRLMAWRIAWQAFLERPILGWGPENFKFVFHRHYNPDYLTHGFAETVWDKTHNWILELAATSGILGVLSYLGIFAVAFYLLLKKQEQSLFTRTVLAAGLLAYFIQNLFIFETTNSLIVFFLLLAFTSSLRNYENNEITKNNNITIKRYNNETVDKEKYFSVKAIGFILLAILVTISLWNYHIKPLRASYLLAKADEGFYKNNFSLWLKPVLKSFEIKYPQEPEALEIISRDLVAWDTKYQVNDQEMAKILPILAERLENQTKKLPEHFVYYIWLGQVYTMMCERMRFTPAFPTNYESARITNEEVDYCEKADESYRTAIKIAPERQDAKLLLAKVKLLKKDFDAAIKINRELVESQPDLPVTHWFLGLSLIGGKKIDEGILELEKGADFGLTYVKNVLYMIDLYYGKKEYNKIIDLYKRLLVLEPKKAADWWARLAATYAAMGDKVRAEEAVTRAVELNPALEAEARAFLQGLGQK